MTSEEKSAWIMGVVAVATYGIYLSTIFSLADGPIYEVAYAWPMVWAIVSAIVASIILHILVAVMWPNCGRIMHWFWCLMSRQFGEAVCRPVNGGYGE